MPDSCRPPLGTKRGTFHWLRRPDGKLIVLEWRDTDGWLLDGNAEYRSPRRMEQYFWRYIAPCASPEEPPHD